VIGQTGVILVIRTWAGCGSNVIVACDTQEKGTMEETIFGIRIIRVQVTELDIILGIFGR